MHDAFTFALKWQLQMPLLAWIGVHCHFVLDTESLTTKSHSGLDPESINVLDPETSLSRCNRDSGWLSTIRHCGLDPQSIYELDAESRLCRDQHDKKSRCWNEPVPMKSGFRMTMQLKQDCPCDRPGFSMTNERCHSESRRREESLLLNDEILRPEEIGT